MASVLLGGAGGGALSHGPLASVLLGGSAVRASHMVLIVSCRHPSAALSLFCGSTTRSSWTRCLSACACSGANEIYEQAQELRHLVQLLRVVEPQRSLSHSPLASVLLGGAVGAALSHSPLASVLLGWVGSLQKLPMSR